MRKLLISLAAASTLGVASPAAAQFFPQPQGYAYGYHDPYNYGQVRRFDARIHQVVNDVRRSSYQGRLSRSEAIRLERRALELRNELHWAARNGLNRRERVNFDRRIDRLRAEMRAEMRDGRRWGRSRYDRDGDGRDDRWERQHDRWHDRHDD